MRLIENTLTGELQEVEVFDPAALGVNEADRGEIPAGVPMGAARWNGSAIAADMAGLKAAKWASAKMERNRRQLGTFRMGTNILQADENSRRYIRALARQAADGLRGLTFTAQFRTADNGEMPVNSAEMLGIELALADFDASLYAHAAALRTAIAAATTVAQLDAINIAAGWPGAGSPS